MATKKKQDLAAIEVEEISKEGIRIHILGTTPYLSNAMSAKAKGILIFPPARLTPAQRAHVLKHNPLREYRDSCYLFRNPAHPTAIGMLATAFKSALRNAALDVPGATKSQIGRLTYVRGDMVNLWGVPQISTMIVKQAGIDRTPDVRIRAILPRWATTIEIEYVVPMLKPKTVLNLLSAAGITQGVGDGRPEKGKLSYGQFRIVNADDPEFLEIVESGGRAAQVQALESPPSYDDETARLLEWFFEEADRRGFNARDEDWELSFSEVVNGRVVEFAGNGA